MERIRYCQIARTATAAACGRFKQFQQSSEFNEVNKQLLKARVRARERTDAREEHEERDKERERDREWVELTVHGINTTKYIGHGAT